MYIFHVPQVGKRDLVTVRTVLTDPLAEVQDILGNSTTVHWLQFGVKDYSLTHLPPILPASFDNSQVFSIFFSFCFTYLLKVGASCSEDSVKRGFASVGCHTFAQVEEGFISGTNNIQQRSESFSENDDLVSAPVNHHQQNYVRFSGKFSKFSNKSYKQSSSDKGFAPSNKDNVSLYKGQTLSNTHSSNKVKSSNLRI